MKLLITGATGTAGSEVLRLALADKRISEVVVISRKPLEVQDSKLRVIIHQDFLDYASLAGEFATVDVCVWCLGVSQTQVRKEQYFTITHEYTVQAARVLLQANPRATFIFLSGQGADQTGQSGVLFAKVKGQTEADLQKFAFKNLYIARPAGIVPARWKKHLSWQEVFILAVPMVTRYIVPSWIITATELARALLRVAVVGSEVQVLDNRTLKRVAQTYTA